MKMVLITGVAGFIGSNLAEALLERDFRVLGIDNLSQGFRRNFETFASDPRFEFHERDICEPGLDALVDRADSVVHLAAFKIPRYGNTLDTLRINTQGTRAVLEAAKRRGCRVVLASTSDVYGRNPGVPFDESGDLWMGPTTVPRWSYAASKIYDEQLCFTYHEQFGLPVVVIRFFGGYGPRQNPTWWGGPQSVFIDAALRDTEMEIHGDGRQKRSFTYVSDHVDGIIRCVESPEAAGEVFNIGNTGEITILGLAELVWRLAGKGKPKLKMVSYRTFGKYEDVRRRLPDISKARRILGFEPRVDLESGLVRTIEWQRAL